MAPKVCRRTFIVEARVLSLFNKCDFGGGQSVTVTGFSTSNSVSPCQYNPTNAPYPFIYLPPTLYNVQIGRASCRERVWIFV
jgi:hypothetical protein